MNPAQRPDSVEMADYVGVLRRRWWVVLALACVGLVGAYAYVTVAQKTYTATAAVNVTPTAADQSSQVANSRTASAAVNLDTEAQVVQSTNVAEAAGRMMHSALPPSKLSQQVAVTVPPNSSVLDISCSAPTAAGAAQCAEDFANAYLHVRSTTAAAAISSQLKVLQGKINSLQVTVSKDTAKVRRLPHSSVARLNEATQLKTAQAQLHALTGQAARLLTASADTTGGSIITNASAPSKPSSPQKLLVLPSGLVVGLLLGLVFSFVLDRRDKRIHGPEDVERLLNMPVLIDLRRAGANREVALASPRSKLGQAFAELGHTVAAALGEGNHVLLVGASSSGAAGSMVAANLAATLARTYSEVVLVCADMTSNVLPELFRLGDGDGLTEVMAGSAAPADVMRTSPGVPGLWVIPPGADSSAGFYSFRYDIARSLMAELRDDARFVIIEAQASEGGDVLALGEFADAALIVAEVPRTTRRQVADSVRRLRQLRAVVLGAVTLPPLGSRPPIRPVSAGLPRPSAGMGEVRRDASGGGRRRGRGEAPRPYMPQEAPDRRGQPPRSRDGLDSRAPADRVPGR